MIAMRTATEIEYRISEARRAIHEGRCMVLFDVVYPYLSLLWNAWADELLSLSSLHLDEYRESQLDWTH
jgi:hypothetical protein